MTNLGLRVSSFLAFVSDVRPKINQSLKGAMKDFRISLLSASLGLILSPAAMATEGGGTNSSGILNSEVFL